MRDFNQVNLVYMSHLNFSRNLPYTYGKKHQEVAMEVLILSPKTLCILSFFLRMINFWRGRYDNRTQCQLFLEIFRNHVTEQM